MNSNRLVFHAFTLLVLAAAAAGCGDKRTADAGFGPAEVSLAITEAPPDVSCIRVAAAGARTAVASFDVQTGQSTVYRFKGLPTGPVSFRAEAFPGPCSDDATESTWLSDPVTVSLKPGANGTVTLAMRGRASIAVGVDFPGFGPGDWTSLDGSPPGTPAQAAVDPAQSDGNQTTLTLAIHGLFVAHRLGPDNQSYTAILVPGLPNLSQVGAPALPAYRAVLGLASGAEATLAASERIPGKDFEGYAWPATRPERDATGAPPGSLPELFQRDDRIYAGKAVYPAAAAIISPRATVLAGIEGSTIELHPVEYSPADQRIRVYSRASYRFSHAGQKPGPAGINRETRNEARATFVNWAAIEKLIPLLTYYQGEFLFIYPPGYQMAMAPLVAQKWSRGFTVTELTTDATGTSCTSIRAAIKAWHDSRGGTGDFYAILVGDTNQIPLCTGPVAATPTDHLYASTNGDDLDPEVLLGRFSVTSVADASDQVTKTLAYEESPDALFNYGRVLLVAHRQDAPGKYVGAHEAVRTAPYTVAPSFTTLYGHIPGVANLDVGNSIGYGQGLVAYRGHGSEVEWWSWDTSGQSYFGMADVAALSNAITPIVWSIACSNAALDTSQSIAETWMQSSNHRAVAHYGATEPSWTENNHKLDYYLFQAVYTQGLTTHAKAIRYAEKQMVLIDPVYGAQNAWKYLLLGDPEMRIRRGPSLNIGLLQPACAAEGCQRLLVAVRDPQGNALPETLVSFARSGPNGLAPASGYTNSDGFVSFEAPPKGTLVLEARVHGDDLPTQTIEVP